MAEIIQFGKWRDTNTDLEERITLGLERAYPDDHVPCFCGKHPEPDCIICNGNGWIPVRRAVSHAMVEAYVNQVDKDQNQFSAWVNGWPRMVK